MKIVITILNYIDIAAPLLVLFFFIKPFRNMVRELHYVFYFVLVQFTTNTAALIMQELETPNYAAYATNVILSFAILAILFFRMNSRSLRNLVAASAAVFTVVTVYSLAGLDGIDNYSSIVSALASFIITACCLVFFYWRLVHDTKTPGLTNSALFWIIIGIFTYYTGSFFIFISYNYLITKNAASVGILWRFHNLLLTIFCIYTIYALTCKNYQKT